MRVTLFVIAAMWVCSSVIAGIDDDDILYRRGDANNDASVNNTDVVFLSNYLFQGGSTPVCMNQADVNHDGYVDNSDVIYLGNWLYNGGPVPPAPGPYATECSWYSSPHISCVAALYDQLACQ